MNLKSLLGIRIVQYRKMRSMTQQELAYKADISISHLRNIEHGTSNTTIDVVDRLAETLSVSPWYLLAPQ